MVSKVVVSRTWTVDDQQSEHDQAFLVLDRPSDVSENIGFGRPGGREAHEYGYPRAARKPGHQGRPEFTGQRLAQCWGTPVRNPGHPELPQHNTWGVPCDMGGGSSGGPRMSGGAVVGVNTESFYLGEVRHLGGPQFSWNVTGPLYAKAQISS